MKCRKCGTELPDDSLFCMNCGVKQNKPPKNKLVIFLIATASILFIAMVIELLFLVHVFCIHRWQPSNCTTPEICTICGKTRGTPLGHDFSEVTCTEDSFCTVCGKTGEKATGHQWTKAGCEKDSVCKVCGETGEKATGHQWTTTDCEKDSFCTVCGKKGEKAKGHQWSDATCTTPEICTVCGKTQGEALGHDWIPATYDAPSTCSRCGETTGNKLEKTYSTSFSVYDIAQSIGLHTAAHEIIIVDSVSADNGVATVSGIDMWGTTAAETINVTGCKKGKVVITGTFSTLAQDTSARHGISFTATTYIE